MDVFVGSTSRHKCDAVENACSHIFTGNIEVNGMKASSGINEQPVGNDETLLGAMNRLADLKRQIGTSRYDLLVALEGGIFPVRMNNQETWSDIGWAVIEDADGNQAIAHSAGIQFPTEDVEEARRRGFDTTTVGSIIAEKTGADGTDPHEHLTGGLLKRSQLLEQSLRGALGQLLLRSEKLRGLKK